MPGRGEGGLEAGGVGGHHHRGRARAQQRQTGHCQPEGGGQGQVGDLESLSHCQGHIIIVTTAVYWANEGEGDKEQEEADDGEGAGVEQLVSDVAGQEGQWGNTST